MATGTAPSTVLPPPPPPQLPAMREHERVVLKQLRRTSFHVRLVDLASSLLFLVGGVLVFLLLTALVDHWVVSLGTIGRFAAMLVLTASVLFYLVRFVAPLLIRSINPTFAARTIEEAKPSLKNSLINFLLLRQDKSGIREVVYEAIEAKAASDVAAVPVEATVDRSRLIWAGYVLCGVLALFAAYKIFSPKDPFQTVARVATPWADIARPSRVVIKDVQPGNAEVYHGQQVKVSAEIHGVREGEEVKLLISTADGQTVNQPVAMKLAEGGLRYECILPPLDAQSQAAGSGMQQDMSYRMIAGDAETSEYRLTVVAAPTIIVDRVEYVFPAYTKKPPEVVAQQGDLKTIEGTRVTIHATSNQPMKSAWIEFDPHAGSGPTETMQLAVKGTRASGTLTMLLKDDRQTPWHTSYQVRFYNDRGRISEEPILHKIDVIRDLPPEVQILQPEQLRVEVPEDGEQRIEVRGVDPDFALSRLALEGTAPAKKVTVELLEAAAEMPPQATVQHVFRPREHKLVAGDELKLVAAAEDNRHSPKTQQPEPNITRTAEYTIVITAASRAGDQEQQNRDQPGNQNDQRQGPAAQQKPGANQDNRRDPRNDQQQGDQPPRESQQEQPMQGGANNQQKQQPGNQQPMQPQDGQQQSDQQQGGSPQQGGAQSKDKNQSGEQQQGESQSSPGGSAGSKSEGQSSAENQSEGSPSGGGQSGASQQGSLQQGNPMNEDGQPAGAGQGSTSGQPSGNSSQKSGVEGDPSADASGQPSGSGERQGKAHEGEAIEEVLKDLQEQQSEGQPGEGQQGANTQPGQGSDGGGQQPGSAKTKAGQRDGNMGEGQSPEGNSEGTPPGSQAKSGNAGSNVASGEQPAPNDQDPMTGAGRGKQTDKPGDRTKSPDPSERTPDDEKGRNPSQQKSDGNKGGASQGGAATDKGQQSEKSEGQQKDPGAGQTGDEGAGDKSQDKAGSGQGQEANRDTPKEQQPDGGTGEKAEPSAASGSKKQSDSKGQQSGDQSGGGKQGAGQPSAQKGNDSPGSQSAADEGAGAAQETGSGETGSQAGNQQKADGKTGQSSDQAGDGSKSGQGEKGKTGGKPKSGQQLPSASEKSDAQKGDGATDGANQPGSTAGGTEVTGGGDGNRPIVEYGPQGEAEAGDEANLEYARKSTEMALERLRDQEHNPDPELLDRLGWTKDDLQEFLRRWDSLKKSAAETPEGKREMDEALKSLGLRNPANRRRAGGGQSDSQRDLRDSGSRSSPPAKYRDLFDAFRKGTSRSSE